MTMTPPPLAVSTTFLLQACPCPVVMAVLSANCLVSKLGVGELSGYRSKYSSEQAW